MTNFDDSDLFSGFADDENDINSAQPIDNNNEYGGFDANASEGLTQDKSAVIKTALTVIIAGVVILLLVFGFMRIFGGNKQPKNQANEPSNNTVQQPTNDSTQNNNQSTTSSSADGWQAFGKTSITFNEEYSKLTFTITGIKHLAKRVDSNGNLEVKTVLTGSLSGYGGTYELEVPYSTGYRLEEGKYFSVEVQVGNFDGKSVIGEIKF